MPYLLIQQVVLPITCVQVEASVLTRNLVPHGVFKGAVVNQGSLQVEEEVNGKVTSELLSQTTPTAFGFIGSRESDDCHTSMSADPHNPRS